MIGDNGDSARHAAQEVGEAFGAVFRIVDDWGAAIRRELEAPGRSVSTAKQLDPIVGDLAIPQLLADGLITGAGFVAAPGFLSDAAWHLAWWLRRLEVPAERGPDAALRRLATVDDPEADQFRDYTTLEWWRVPATTGRRHVTGPYVDYLCTDDYTVTITAPVGRVGAPVGVVGADVHVSRMERALMPVLRSVPGAVTIVSHAGRVIISNETRRAPGSLLRIPGVSEALAGLLAEDAEDSGNPGDGRGGVTELDLPDAKVLRCGDAPLGLVFHG
ncbi:hypothetical protein AB3K78_00500 [Leucobacter sp. HNU]|uniref:PDC sensor domain-containing protein n=1 Tax=Leucobacter sp. HNU TaxID=3236805 RepID=UPI003A7FCF41